MRRGGEKTPVSPIFAQLVVQRKSRGSLHWESRRNNGTYVPAHRVRPEGGERELSPPVRVAITADRRVDFARSFSQWEHDNVSDKTAQSRILRDRLRVADVC